MDRFATERKRIRFRQLLLRCRLLLLVMLPLYASPVAAGILDEIKTGILYHDTGFWGGSGKESGIDFNVELIFSPSVRLMNGQLRPNLGISLNNHGDTSKIYGGGLWEYSGGSGWFAGFGLGLAVHDGEIDEEAADESSRLGSALLFRLSFEAGFNITANHRLSLMYDHISNAYLADPNEGLDTCGVRYGYRF